MKLFFSAAALIAVLAAGSASAQQIQTGTPRDTSTSPTATNNGERQPASTNPSTERMTGTAGSKAEQARSGAESVKAGQPPA